VSAEKLAVLVALAACSHTPTVQERWLRARGTDRGSVGCVKVAAAMRAECAGDKACEERVSYDFSYWCYAGVYDRADDRSRPDGADIGPCFWDKGWGAFACDQIGLAPDLVPHCEAEKKFAAEVLCWMGSTDLTGAGP
jgi:hypothetical protein